ncbi:hypothetical protein [Haloarchaeobius litoreus]|uniref:Uncharacterized protein n=1 Tax=Haloarchaeobius litoreus TaxID=755306 RepID=A0ABD6DIR8_9EURY|nr:hypothetical protein [Haloarchaeobius litoreus]
MTGIPRPVSGQARTGVRPDDTSWSLVRGTVSGTGGNHLRN